MTGRERFYATVKREAVDRPACWLGLPAPESLPALYRYFGVRDLGALKRAVDDDVYPVEMPYHSAHGDGVYNAFDFAKKQVGERTLTVPGFFEDYSDPDRVDDFAWPDPDEHFDREECRQMLDAAPQDKAVLGVIWSAHFQDACAAFGMETSMMKMLLEPEMYRAVIDRIVDFYLRANELFYETAKGKIQAVLIGNDLGSQSGLMVSPELIRTFVLPGTRKLVAQAKEYGLTVIHHSCGSIFDIIPDLIEAGVDVIHPIQALAKNMEPERLKAAYGDKVSFCGGVDTQDLLVNGSPADVKAAVYHLRELFPTGLVISPSHEAILPDVRAENVRAVFEAVYGMRIDTDGFSFDGAIFDVDETLIETLDLWNDINEGLMRQYDVPVSDALLKRLNTLSLTHALSYLIEQFHLDVSPGVLRAQVWEAAKEAYRNVPLKEGAREYLAALRKMGVRLAVATSNGRDLIEAALLHNGIYDWFDAVCYTDDYQTDKRSPKLYLEAARLLALRPEQCVVFEDLLEGLQSAKSAGFFAAAVLCDSPLYDLSAVKAAADTAFSAYRELIS